MLHSHALNHLLTTAVLGALLLLSPAITAATQPGGDSGRRPVPSVTVNGEGRVTALPDQAALQLGVQARDEDLAQARAAVTERTNAVLAHLASLGLAERHINATHINVQPEYRWDKPREEQVLTGYRVQRSIDLALMDLSTLPAVIEGSADAGADRVSPPRLSHSNEAELRRDALRLAAEDARANAATIAQSLGATLGGVREISVMDSARPVPLANDRMLRTSMDKTATEASYVAGEMVFEARVSATFQLTDSAGEDSL